MSERDLVKTSESVGIRRFYTKIGPLLVAAIFAALGLGIYAFKGFSSDVNPYINTLNNELNQWGVILAGYSFIYGFFSLILMHSRRLALRKESSRELYGSALYLGVILLIIGIIITSPGNVNSASIALISTYILTYIDAGVRIDWLLFPYLNFKMFKLSSMVTTIILVVFVIRILRSSPMIAVLWPPIIAIGDWFSFIPQNATFRAATICSGISAVLFGLRSLVLKEPGLIELEV